MDDPPPTYDGRSLMAIALALRDDMTSLFAEKNAEIAQRDATILALQAQLWAAQQGQHSLCEEGSRKRGRME